MKFAFRACTVVWAIAAAGAHAQVTTATLLGATVESLLAVARERNPDYAVMRHETSAAQERILMAGALMDPKFKLELQDITKMGEQSPSILPSNVGATAYAITQEFPWSGKRDLKRDIASFESEGAKGRAQQTWSDMAARIKVAFVQRYQVQGNQRLVNQNLDLLLQLEKVMQVRYASGLAAQQDVTRIHVEHTGMRAELVAMAGEWRQTQARLNALLGRSPEEPLAAPERLRPLPEPSKLDFAVLSERLRRANPQIFVESFKVKSAEKTRELAYKNRYPDFMVGLNAMQRGSDVKEWGLMVEINIPIRDSVLRSQERESEAMLAAAHSRREAIENQMLADLSDNLTGLETAG